MSFIIAIDGPTASGKSTVADLIAKEINFIHIQSGAMFRCVSLEMIKSCIKIDDLNSINSVLNTINIDFITHDQKQLILLNGKDVTDLIRTKVVTDYSSKVASIREVRMKLLEIQRKMAKKSNIIMDGRDIGTTVFPDADVKFFLDANPIVRAKRKQKELEQIGENLDLNSVLKSIYIWDKDAIERKEGALKKAKDCIYIDTSEMQLEELKNKMIEEILRIYEIKFKQEVR